MVKTSGATGLHSRAGQLRSGNYRRVIRAGFALNGGRPEETLFIDTLPHVNWKMRLGGYLSRWPPGGVDVPGHQGTQQAYRNLIGW